MLDLDALTDLDRALADLHSNPAHATISFPSDTNTTTEQIDVAPSSCPHLSRMAVE